MLRRLAIAALLVLPTATVRAQQAADEVRVLESTPILTPDTTTREDFIRQYGEELGRSCWEEFAQKRLDRAATDKLNARIHETWDTIRERITSITYPTGYLETVLLPAEAPTTASEIHLQRPFYEQSLLRCREIRNRFTFLDIAIRSGLMESCLSDL